MTLARSLNFIAWVNWATSGVLETEFKSRVGGRKG